MSRHIYWRNKFKKKHFEIFIFVEKSLVMAQLEILEEKGKDSIRFKEK